MDIRLTLCDLLHFHLFAESTPRNLDLRDSAPLGWRLGELELVDGHLHLRVPASVDSDPDVPELVEATEDLLNGLLL
jgi:hypothetical protein